MIKAKKWLLITFYTTADAMKMEKTCRLGHYPGKLVPVPRSITSDCGIAWQTEIGERPVMEQVAAGMDVAGFYEVEY